MGWFRHLSIRSQLLIVLLAVGLSGIFVVTVVGYRSGQRALKQAVLNQLRTVTATKARQVENYFEQTRSEIETFSQNPSIASTIVDLEKAIEDLSHQTLRGKEKSELETFYARDFLPKLANSTGSRPSVVTYFPQNAAAQWLQYHYISHNPHKWDDRSELIDANDGTSYSRIHQKVHPMFKDIAERLEYFDIYLVSLESGRVLYSISKEPDFGSDLLTGPFSDSSLADAFRHAREQHDPGTVVISDYKVHTPSFGVPSAFFAAPVFLDHARVGVILVQLSVDKVDDIMTSHRQWRAGGLGATGEAYIVGDDKLFRSNPRLLLEDEKTFLKTLIEPQPAIVKRIETFNTSILNQRAMRPLDQAAIEGRSGVGEFEDYRGEPVLAAFQPIRVPGLSWGITAKMDRDEALASVTVFGRQVMTTAVIFVAIVTMLSLWLSVRFLSPVKELVEAAHQVGKGNDRIQVKAVGSDEFADLARTFNDMVISLQKSNAALVKKTDEHEKLLLNVLPAHVAERVKKGQDHIADTIPNVTVLYADLGGFLELSKIKSADELVTLLNEVVAGFDEAAERNGVEKVKTIGSAYMAVCGLGVPRVDHMHRMIQFAKEMQSVVLHVSQRHNIGLDISIGINSGSVIAGLVGRQRFIFDLWGDTVNLARGLQRLELAAGQTQSQSIRVSQTVRDGVAGLHEFEHLVPRDGKTSSNVWALRS